MISPEDVFLLMMDAVLNLSILGDSERHVVLAICNNRSIGDMLLVTIRPVARTGYGSIAFEAKPNELLGRGPRGRRV